jgi:hypothetical protein
MTGCRWLTLAVAAFALALAGCGGEDAGRDIDAGGDARPFLMGFSSLPRELNAESYADAIDFAGEYGDVVLIQRELPWSEFVPGAEVGADLIRTTAAERDAVRDRDLRLFFAVDLTDGATGRDRLVGLPPDLTGKHFGDPAVQQAVLSYAEYVAINYRPDYLALGVEMNLYFQQEEESFGDFVSLYEAAYAVVKERSPQTEVTVTFQYEDLQGLLPRDDPHFAEWQLLEAFGDRLDFVAISTYPSFAFSSAAAIPENYYRKLRAFTDRPIAIAEMGYASTPGQEGLNSGTEEDQAAFLARILQDAGDLQMPFAVWFSIWDPSYARDTAFHAFQSIGLRRTDDSPKPAWQTWAEHVQRPYAGEDAATLR